MHLRNEQIRVLYSQAIPALGMGLLVAFLLATQLWPRVDHGLLVPWIVAHSLVTAGRFGLIYAFGKTKAPTDLTQWGRAYTAGAMLGGTLWGSAVLFLELTSSPTDQLVIIIVLAGISTAAIPTNASCLTTYLGFAGPVLLPLAGWILYQQSPEISRSLAPISLILMALLIFTARNYHRNLIASLSLRLENLALVESLSRKAAVPEESQQVAGLGSWESEAARQELQLTASVFSHCLQAIMITDKRGHILKVNPAFSQITGYAPEEAIGESPRLFRSHQHDDMFYQNLWRSLSETGRWQGEIWNRRKNGELFPIWQTITSVHDDQGEIIRYISIFDDISEKKEWEDRIHHLAFFDALTELPNRRLFEERLSHGLELVHRTQQHLALLLVDLDRFKAVNDTLGHPIGDQLLRQIATRMRHCVREEDTVARLGGDEFAVILENINTRADAETVARKILSSLSYPVELEANEIVPSASIGISIYPADGNDTETLVRKADTALYKAKDQGRNSFQFYTEERSKTATKHLAL